jgi:Na+-driven multidrug efflux pump
MRNWRLVLMVVLAAVVVLLLSAPADAQCSMCRAVLTGSNNARFMRNLNIGVLVLLIPPVTIFCSIFVILRKYRGTDG